MACAPAADTTSAPRPTAAPNAARRRRGRRRETTRTPDAVCHRHAATGPPQRKPAPSAPARYDPAMRRLGRWTLNTLTVLSLVLCVGTAGLWVRSYWHTARLELTVRRV